jgi:hypothetical protein
MDKIETIEEAAKEYDAKAEYTKYVVEDAFISGAKWQAERISIDISEKWLLYRLQTNNEDAYCFKEWLVEQFKKK